MNTKFIIISLLISLFSFQSLAMENDNDINNNFSIQRHPKRLNEMENQSSRSLPQVSKPFPIGGIIAFAGPTPPDEWLMCDGKQYHSKDYPDLYKVIQTNYVPDSEQWVLKTNEVHDNKLFHVPDLRGRVIIAPDNESERVSLNNKLGKSGGKEDHQLTVNEMPSHTHMVIAYGGGPKPAVDGLYPNNSSIRGPASKGVKIGHKKLETVCNELFSGAFRGSVAF